MGRIETIAIGNELLDGRVLDSNARHLAGQAHPLGWTVGAMAVIPDTVETICDYLQRASARADVLVCSGGLGPTDDDLTRKAVAEWLGVELYDDAESLAELEAKFKAFGVKMAPNNRRQATFPTGATILRNNHGTAPAFSVEHNGCTAYFLPGVPREYRALCAEYILPKLSPKQVVKRTVVYFGVGESSLEEKLRDIPLSETMVLGYRAHFPEIHVSVSSYGPTAQEEVDAFVDAMQSRIGHYFVAEGSTLGEQIIEALKTQTLTLASAESCTGGMIGAALTNVPGASAVYPGSIVSYANAAKETLLGVPRSLLDAHGAVSKEVAVAMAQGATDALGADIAVSVTGIAGPGGGSAEKPVGTVHIGMQTPAGTFHRKLSLRGHWGRDRIRSATVHHALMMVLRWLEGRVEEDRKIEVVQ